MTLGSDLAEALVEMRQLAESRMGSANGGSTATIRRAANTPVLDPNTGVEADTWTDVYTDLPIRLSGTAANSAPYRVDTTSGVQVDRGQRIVNAPAATTGLEDGDLVELTAGENAGTVWKLLDADWQDQATARRMPAVQVDRPAEWGTP